MSLPVAPLALSDGYRAELGRLLASGPPRTAERAQIVLACARRRRPGATQGVAAELGLATDTVRKWRERFLASGVAGLADGARPGRPKAGLVLTEVEREQLAGWARRGKTSQVLALRAKIVLACADGGDRRRGQQGHRGRVRGRRAHGRPVAGNESPCPFAWTKTAEEILSSLGEYLSRISGGAH